MDQISSISVNFEKLVQIRAKFIKIDSDVLKQTLVQDLSSASLKKLEAELDNSDCDLTITKVEEEQTLVNLLSFNIDFGQDSLFGISQLVPVHN